MDSKWFHMVPVFVTRSTADGFIFNIAVPFWLALVLAILVLFNMLLWGSIGIYEAVRFIF